VRFQDAARDARAVVYAGIQADPVVARADGETGDPGPWRAMFPTLFGDTAAAATRDRAEAILEVASSIAGRGEQVRSQFRGAVVEELAQHLLARRVGDSVVRRERRILFDGVRAEIHPYDVTVERDTAPEAWDCKWGARGIAPDVLHQLDDARRHAADEGARLRTGLVVFDARRSCAIRLARQTAPTGELRLVTIETLDRLAGAPAPAS
jgi:hypothetical protein